MNLSLFKRRRKSDTTTSHQQFVDRHQPDFNELKNNFYLTLFSSTTLRSLK